MGIHDCLHGPRACKLGLVMTVMGQHIDIISQHIGDSDIIVYFRVQQL